MGVLDRCRVYVEVYVGICQIYEDILRFSTPFWQSINMAPEDLKSDVVVLSYDNDTLKTKRSIILAPGCLKTVVEFADYENDAFWKRKQFITLAPGA